jgi:N-acetylglucosamine kinase-like BadF-type ATPase
MSYVLGVDGGNTKTIALVAALDGRIVGAGRAGCSDLYNTKPGKHGESPTDAALANIDDAVTQALQAANIETSDLAAGVFNLAGADWPEDFTFLESVTTEHGWGRKVIIQNDAMGVLHAGSPDNTGVSVVCGTGAAIGSRGPDGRFWHSSFWQHEFQGGAHMGRKTVTAVFNAELGIEPPTALTDSVLAYYNLATVEDLLHLFTGRLHKEARREAPSISGLAPILLDAAEAGDSAARRIVREHGWGLGNYAQVAARRVDIEGTPFRLVLAGGVLRHPSSLLADAIIERVRTTSPDVRPIRSPFEPIIGVLFTALETAGVTIDDDLLERLIPTIPDAALFATVR